jgi:hypothetical protein
MASRNPLNLAMILTANAKGVKPATDEARKDLSELGQASRQTETATRMLADAEAEAGRARKVALDAVHGRTAAEHALTDAIQQQTVAQELNEAAMMSNAMHQRQLMFQLVDIGQAIPLAFQSPIYAMQNLGFQVAQIGQLYAGRGGLTQAAKDSAVQVGNFATTALTRFPLVTAAVAAGGAALVGMQHEINAVGGSSVTMADVFMGNLHVIESGVMSVADTIGDWLAPAIDTIAPIFASAWDQVLLGFKTVNNALIAGWKTAFDAIRLIWGDFPEVMGDLSIKAGNLWLSGLETVLNQGVVAVKEFYRTLNPIARLADAVGNDTFRNIFGTGLADGLKFDLQIDNPFEGAAGKLGADLADAVRENFSTDYLGQYFEAVSRASQEHARLRREAEDAGDASKDAAEKATDPWNGLRKAVEQSNEELRFHRDVAGGTLTDIRRALADGKLDWEEIGDVATNALDRIIDKLQGDFLDAIFGAGGRGGGGDIFSIIGRLFGGGASSLPVAPVLPAGGWGGIPWLHGGGGFEAGELVPFGPQTRVENGILHAHSGIGPRNFKAVLEEGETVLTSHDTERAVNIMRSGIEAARRTGDHERMLGTPNVNITVNVSGASGDPHVRALVRQGVAEGLDEYHSARANQRENGAGWS